MLPAVAAGRRQDRLVPLTAADEVAVLVRRKVIDMRDPAADALLSYRDPPSTERADRMAVLEARVAALEAAARVVLDGVVGS